MSNVHTGEIDHLIPSEYRERGVIQFSQLVKCLHSCYGSHVGTSGVCTRHDTSIGLRESVPWPWRADIYFKRLAKSNHYFHQDIWKLTGGAGVCRTGLDCGALPALDSVEHALLLFAFGSKARDFLAGYHGATGRFVYDAWENGTTMTTGVLLQHSFPIHMWTL